MSAKTSQSKLVQIVENLEFLMQHKSINVLNTLLIVVCNRIHEMDETKMLTYIRTTSPMRNEIPAWKVLYTTIENELTKRGLDATHYLRGLLDPVKDK